MAAGMNRCYHARMLTYVIRRILATIPVMVMVALFVFSLLYIAPGDPAAIIAGDQATPADVERIRASSASTGRSWSASATGSGTILHGDLGTSIFTNLPVTHMIAQRIEPTLSLMVLTLDPRHRRRHADGRARGVEAGTWIDRAGDGDRGAGLLGAGLRGRLCAGLRVRAANSTGCRCRASRRSSTASCPGSQSDPAGGGARPGLHGADRAHHARDHAGRAEPGLHAHREGQGRRPAAACCSSTR